MFHLLPLLWNPLGWCQRAALFLKYENFMNEKAPRTVGSTCRTGSFVIIPPSEAGGSPDLRLPGDCCGAFKDQSARLTVAAAAVGIFEDVLMVLAMAKRLVGQTLTLAQNQRAADYH